VSGNAYRETGEAVPANLQLPRTWHEAIERADRSAFLREALGTEFHRILLAIKAQECAAHSAEVSSTDLAWYLRSV
jgi:glutamine synthetase